MATHTALITREGRVTIPVEIRRALGLKEGDRVRFVQTDGHVTLEPLGSVVEQTAGVFAKYRPERSFTIAEEKAAFVRGVAEEVAESLGREAEMHRGAS